MGTKLETFVFGLGRRFDMIHNSETELWHVISPENATTRIPAPEWREFINNIKLCFSHRLNYSLYADQPVYEYKCSNENLRKVIKEYLETKISCEIVFKDFEYQEDLPYSNVIEKSPESLIQL